MFFITRDFDCNFELIDFMFQCIKDHFEQKCAQQRTIEVIADRYAAKSNFAYNSRKKRVKKNNFCLIQIAAIKDQLKVLRKVCHFALFPPF